MTLFDAMKIAAEGLEAWKAKPHNAKWWRRIDGTPIPNDLPIVIAEAFANTIDVREVVYLERIAKCGAEITTLRAALEPFAAEARFYDPVEQDGKIIEDDWEIWGDCELTVGNLRIARAALAINQPKGDAP